VRFFGSSSTIRMLMRSSMLSRPVVPIEPSYQVTPRFFLEAEKTSN
jgi:hypothetical protein